MLLGGIFMPEREETTRRANFDWLGFVLLSVSVSCTLIALSNGQREGWSSNFVLGYFATAAIAGTGFVVHQLIVQQPLVNFRVLGTGQFAAAAGVAVVFGMGQQGTTYLIPLFVQTVQGNTPLAAGLLLMPGALLMGLFMPAGGYLADRYAARALLMTGLACFAASTWWLRDADTNTPYLLILLSVVVSRAGQSLINPTLIATALRTLQSQLLRQGSGMINFCRQMGGAFGVNLLSVMLDRRTFYHSDALTSQETPANSATRQFLDAVGQLLAHAGASPDLQSAGALHYLGKVVYAQAYTLAFRDCFMIVSAFFVIALIPAWIMGMRRRNPVATPHRESPAAPLV
jgi:nitrate/nitrite transporter NarK